MLGVKYENRMERRWTSEKVDQQPALLRLAGAARQKCETGMLALYNRSIGVLHGRPHGTCVGRAVGQSGSQGGKRSGRFV